MTDEEAKSFRELLERCVKQAAEYREKFPGLTGPQPGFFMGHPVLWPGDMIHQRKDGKLQITRVEELN